MICLRTSVVLCVIFVVLPNVVGKDGFIFSDTPPIAVRFGTEEFTQDLYIALTNTSDEVVHAVVLTAELGGRKKSTIIIDTILPDKTVALSSKEFASVLFDKFEAKPRSKLSLTCLHFSKPLSIEDWWAAAKP